VKTYFCDCFNLKSFVTAAQDASALVQYKDGGGWTSLHHAAVKGHSDVLVELLKIPSDLTLLTPLLDTPFDKARAAGSGCCERLLTDADIRFKHLIKSHHDLVTPAVWSVHP
jgi:ankyrin repeat protein